LCGFTLNRYEELEAVDISKKLASLEKTEEEKEQPSAPDEKVTFPNTESVKKVPENLSTEITEKKFIGQFKHKNIDYFEEVLFFAPFVHTYKIIHNVLCGFFLHANYPVSILSRSYLFLFQLFLVLEA